MFAGVGDVYTAILPLVGGPGTYTIRVTATDNAGNVSQTAVVAVTLGGVVVPIGYTGPTHGSIGAGSVGVKGGVTTTSGVVKVRSSNVSALQVRKKGAKITILFVGSRIDLHFAATKASGIAIITIDGKRYVLDGYAGHAHDLLKALAHLKGGKHKVTIVSLGTRNARSAGTYVTLTLFRVYA